METVGQLAGLLKIGVGAGLTLAKSNDQKQFNADASASYETTSYNISASIHSDEDGGFWLPNIQLNRPGFLRELVN